MLPSAWLTTRPGSLANHQARCTCTAYPTDEVESPGRGDDNMEMDDEADNESLPLFRFFDLDLPFVVLDLDFFDFLDFFDLLFPFGVPLALVLALPLPLAIADLLDVLRFLPLSFVSIESLPLPLPLPLLLRLLLLILLPLSLPLRPLSSVAMTNSDLQVCDFVRG